MDLTEDRVSDRDGIDNTEQKLLLDTILQKLPIEQRETVILRFREELRFQDIARILGCSVVHSKIEMPTGNQTDEKGVRKLMKENSDLNKLFCEADRFVKIDKERRERTLERLYSVYEEMNGERTSVTAGYAEIVFSQLRYMDKGIWIADAAVNILFILILLLLRYYGAEEQDIMGPRCCLHLLPERVHMDLIWAFSNGARETGGTCYFNTKQLAGLEMTLLGGINLIMIAFAVFMSEYSEAESFSDRSLYGGSVSVYCICMSWMHDG